MIKTLHASYEDQQQLCELHRDAWRELGLYQKMYAASEVMDFDEAQRQIFEKAMESPRQSLIKATMNGKVVGYALYQLHGGATAKDIAMSGTLPKCKGANSELIEDYSNSADRILHRLVKQHPSGFLWCFLLAVDPQYRRQGVGRQLVEWAKHNAKAGGMPLYVDANQSRPFWFKCGFRPTGATIDFNNGKDRTETLVCHV